MYAIDTSNHTVNDKKVDTFLRTVLDGDTHLEVEAGTTGFTGACCRDAGSRTYLALLCRKGDFFFGPIKDDEGRTVGIRIACSRSVSSDRMPGSQRCGVMGTYPLSMA